MINILFGIAIGVFLTVFAIIIGAAVGPDDEFDDLN